LLVYFVLQNLDFHFQLYIYGVGVFVVATTSIIL
jgi:hypothetical protein